VTIRPRLASAAARAGWVALCLLPVSLGIGRFWPIYIARDSGIAYQYRSVALYPADVLVVVTCLGWLGWRLLLGEKPRLPRGNLALIAGVAILALAAAVSIATAYDRLLTLGVTLQLAVLVFFVLASAELLVHFPLRPLLAVLAVVVVSQALLAGWQAATQSTAPAAALFNGSPTEATSHGGDAAVVMLPIAGRWLRSYGTFAHPNILGGFLALSLAFFAVVDDPRMRRWRAVALAAGFMALLLTFSRTAGLAVLFGGVTWLLARRDGPGHQPVIARRARLILAAAVLLIGLVTLVRVGNLGTLVERNSIETRLSSYAVTWSVIGTGIPVGAGNHVLVEQQLFGGGGPAHDVFLIALAELGPLGLLGWLSIFGSLLLLAWRRRAEPAARTGPLVAIASLSPLLLFDHYLWTLAPGRVLVVWALAVLTGPHIARRMVATERPARRLTLAGKRLADVAVASGALLALAPVFGLVAALVWLDSGTPIFFRATRLGRAGRLFTMYKFRTMTPGSEEALLNLRARNLAQGMVKIVDDPRVTVIGSWLRRFSLDELPQLWNVVRGDMSLVGPRPHQIGEVSPDDDGHRQRLAMRPGLTGLWQVKARTNPSLAVRVHYDLEYISRWSPWLDLGVILATIPVVLHGDGGQVRFPDRQLLTADQRADVPETSPI
jgi:lipopolysaccharide/colanic/teichoic acid biosynthesis glycosyltransferase/O-antigen ligase